MRYEKRIIKRQGHLNPLRLAILACCCSAAGCSWDSSLYDQFVLNDKVEKCDPLTAIYLSDGSSPVTPDHPVDEKGIDYSEAFKYHLCPTIAHTCIKKEELPGQLIGICTPCAEGQQLCFNKCVDYDATHIASCDSPDAQTITCKAGYQDCDGEIQNGCEYDLETNHALSCVKNGDAYTVTCMEDYSDCDGNYKNGCEYQLSPNHVIACRDKSVAGYCQSGYGDCNNSYMDGCEINLNNNLEHCGKCSNACPSGQICNGAGVCADTCAAGSVYCGTSCVEISANHIDASQMDGTNRCATLDDGSVYVPCVFDYANCDDNPQNGCEFKLSTLNTLSCESQSLVCRDGFADCDGNYLTGCEYNLIPNHALACMRTEAEDGTVRVTLECAQDYADCDGDYLNGCEYQLSTHNATQCERKTDETTNETYVELTCATNMADCDGNYLNGCEYDMGLNHVTACVYNIEYCSSEGVDCDNADISKRGVITCASSFADIDKDYQNGCEIDGKTNLDHCGASGDASSDDKDSPNYKGEACKPGYLCNGGTCGLTCTTPLQNCGGICIDFAANHITACEAGTTSLEDNNNCAAGWTDCDNKITNGCEYNLSDHNASACTNETVTCTGGYENCDGKYLNGCETDILGTDVANCGTCGLDCTDKDNVLYATCHTGQCQATQCEPGYHLSAMTADNTCIQNTATACAAPNAVKTVDCNRENKASAGICGDDGICTITACQEGYHLSSTSAGNICLPNTLAACAAMDSATPKDCASEHLVEGTCENGNCVPKRCAIGYFLNKERRPIACEPNNEKQCSPDGSATIVDCNSANNAAQGKCGTNGICTITACKKGYHLSSTSAGNICVPNTLISCGKIDSDKTIDCTDNKNNLVEGTCDNGVCKATKCAVGHYLTGDKCVANDATKCSPDGGSSSINCNSANNAAQGTCEATGMCKITECAAGYHLSSTHPGNVCIPNTFASCAAVTSDKPVDCAEENHAVSGTCDNGSCKLTRCAIGYYLNDGACQPNTNEACSADGSSHTVNCKTMPNATSGECTNGVCKATQCEAGYYLINDACEPCPAGTYKGEANGDGIASCKACDPGSYSNEPARTTCSSCEKGTYASTTGATRCVPCPANTYADKTGADSCTACPVGETSNIGSDACSSLTCPNGHVYGNTCETNDNTNCGAHGMTCNASKVANSTNATCSETGICKATACQVGYYLNNGACVPCSAGTYKDEANGMTSCKVCAANTYSVAGATSCTNCEDGFYSTPGSAYCSKGCASDANCSPVTGTETMACIEHVCVATQCKAGYYLAANSCVECPAGTYSNIGATACTLCLAGTYNSSTASASEEACTSCGKGSISSAGAASCTACTTNSYEYQHLVCLPSCPTGYYMDGNACVEECGEKYVDENTCVDACGEKYVDGNTCVTSCGEKYVDGNTCVTSCGEKYIHQGECVASCPSGYTTPDTPNTECVPAPPATCGGVDPNGASVTVPHGAWGCSSDTAYFKCDNGDSSTHAGTCSDDTPHCHPNALASSESPCVSCLLDAHCPASEGHVGKCDTTNHTCSTQCDTANGYHMNASNTCIKCTEVDTAWNDAILDCDQTCDDTWVDWCENPETGTLKQCQGGFVVTTTCDHGCTDNGYNVPDTCND